MTEVINLADHRPERHLSGIARCMACKHEWATVAPEGVKWLECPSCGCRKGLYLYPCSPPDGAPIWECKCGCLVFYAQPAGVYCYSCVTPQKF